MFTFLAIVHIVVSVLLVLFILLQDPKGGSGALGILGGGSSKSLFGSTGGNQFLVNVTKWLALLFAFTSIYLATLSAQSEKSVMDDYIPSVEQEKVDSAENQPEGSDQEEPKVDQPASPQGDSTALKVPPTEKNQPANVAPASSSGDRKQLTDPTNNSAPSE